MTSKRPQQMGSRALRARARPAAGLLWGLLVVCLPAAAAAQEGIALNSSTRQSLRHFHDLWDQWGTAIYQNDTEQASATIDDILRIASELQISALPDLSRGAAARALEAARAGQFERAQWALEAARRLDGDRPESYFAAADVARMQNDYVPALLYTVAGWSRLFRLPLERTLVLTNALLWALAAVLLTGAAWIALLFARRGGALTRALHRRLGLPEGAAGTASLAVLLLWPLVLPSGLLWVVLLVSVLLWAWLSTSERVVLALFWIFAGATPLVAELHHRQAEIALSPPGRFLDHLESGRLEGRFFADLTVLRALFPAEDPDVLEVVADLHRRLGQWQDAQTHYRELVEVEPQNAPALINLGVAYHRKGDLTSAVFYFNEAARVDPGSALAYYDLSQSYSQSYSFNESRGALARAKEIDGPRVDAWITSAQGQGAPDMVFASDDPRRITQLRRRLGEQMRATEPTAAGTKVLLPRFLGLGVAALAIVIAFVLAGFVLKRGAGAEDASDAADPSGPPHPLVRALIPGLTAVHEREGPAAVVGLFFPIALLLVPLAPQLGYRLPLGFTPGYGLLAGLALFVVLFLLMIRMRGALRATSPGSR